MGRAKTPTSIKIMRGTFRADRDGDADVAPGAVEPPIWLNEKSLKVWHDVVEKLGSIPGLVTTVDAMSLGRYCQDWVEYWTLLGVVEIEGHTVESEAGNLYQHPAVGAKNKAADRLARFESRFGMTPSDRVGLRVDKPPEGVRSRQRA